MWRHNRGFQWNIMGSVFWKTRQLTGSSSPYCPFYVTLICFDLPTKCESAEAWTLFLFLQFQHPFSSVCFVSYFDALEYSFFYFLWFCCPHWTSPTVKSWKVWFIITGFDSNPLLIGVSAEFPIMAPVGRCYADTRQNKRIENNGKRESSQTFPLHQYFI